MLPIEYADDDTNNLESSGMAQDRTLQSLGQLPNGRGFTCAERTQ